MEWRLSLNELEIAGDATRATRNSSLPWIGLKVPWVSPWIRD
jgi:hypothetical protein